MPLLKREILEIASKIGVKNWDFALKDYIQDKILHMLSDLYEPKSFVFKGGTALFKLYGSPRFSEDLDFSSYDGINVDEIVKRLNLEGFNTRIIKSSLIIGGSVISATLQVSFKGLGSTTIKVEINRMGNLLESEIVEYVSKYPDIPPFTINVATKEQIFRDKIRMLRERRKVRDLFDAYFLAFRYNLKCELSKREKEDILERIKRFKASWKYLGRLLINYELPPFDEVIKVLTEAIIVGED